MKPLVGINGAWTPDGASPPFIAVRANYVAAVAGAGGVPLVLPVIADPVLRAGMIAGQVAACHAFVFVGGPDIDPARYGRPAHPTVGPLHPFREAYDFELLEAVLASRKPLLAVCLGCQELNVHLGGTLVQDIADAVETDIRHSMKQSPYLNRHDVETVPGTALARLMETVEGVEAMSPAAVPAAAPGACRFSANSAHHQSVETPGTGVVVSARSAGDGVIEAIELAGHPFAHGIQWHPEYLQAEPPHRRLFTALVEAARR